MNSNFPVLQDHLYPRWSEATRVHDWRNHVPDTVRENWETFTPQQKYLLMLWAEELASAEEWE